MLEKDWLRFRGKTHPVYCTCRVCQQQRLENKEKRPKRARGPEYSRKRRSSWWRSALMLMAITVGLWAVVWEPDALAGAGTASNLVASGYDILFG